MTAPDPVQAHGSRNGSDGRCWPGPQGSAACARAGFLLNGWTQFLRSYLFACKKVWIGMGLGCLGILMLVSPRCVAAGADADPPNVRSGRAHAAVYDRAVDSGIGESAGPLRMGCVRKPRTISVIHARRART